MTALLRKNLPRYTGATDDVRALSEFMRDVLEYLRAAPEMELVKFTSQMNTPFDVRTEVTNPEIVILRGYQTRDAGASVTPELPSWQRVAGGVRINGVDGFAAGTDYAVSMLVVGG